MDHYIKECRSVEYLKNGFNVGSLRRDKKRKVGQYTHCGVCAGFCPTGVLYVNIENRKAEFNGEKCAG